MLFKSVRIATSYFAVMCFFVAFLLFFLLEWKWLKCITSKLFLIYHLRPLWLYIGNKIAESWFGFSMYNVFIAAVGNGIRFACNICHRRVREGETERTKWREKQWVGSFDFIFCFNDTRNEKRHYASVHARVGWRPQNRYKSIRSINININGILSLWCWLVHPTKWLHVPCVPISASTFSLYGGCLLLFRHRLHNFYWHWRPKNNGAIQIKPNLWRFHFFSV